VLLSGEQFFKTRTSLYDAMPACWTKLSVEARHSVITIIKKIYDRAEELQEPLLWKTADVMELTKYCALDDVIKLRACYLTSKIDPSVIVGGDTSAAASVDVAAENSESNGVATLLDYFTFMPPKLTAKFKESIAGLSPRQVDDDEATARIFGEGSLKVDLSKEPLFRSEAQKELFDHMCNKACESKWNNDKGRQPSDYVKVEYSKVQQQILNPNYKHVLMGFICYDVKGEGTKQKIAITPTNSR
jgi:hypothetical protein